MNFPLEYYWNDSCTPELNDLIVTRHQCIKEIVKSVYKIDSYVWWSGNER